MCRTIVRRGQLRRTRHWASNSAPVAISIWLSRRRRLATPRHASHAARLHRRGRPRRGGRDRRTDPGCRILRRAGGVQRLRRAPPAARSSSARAPRRSSTPTSRPPTNTLQAEIDPAGEATDYQVLYAPIASEWCTSFGFHGTPARAGGAHAAGVLRRLLPPRLGPPERARLRGRILRHDLGGRRIRQFARASRCHSPSAPRWTRSRRPRGRPPAAPPSRITGQNLGGAGAVHFGLAAASIESVTAEEVLVSAPPHADGAVDVTVTTPSGTSAVTEADVFTYEGPGQGSTGPTGPTGPSGPTESGAPGDSGEAAARRARPA